MHFGYLALYGGPDQLMPLTSSLAAIFAFVLMFWGKLLVAFDKMMRFFKGTPSEPVADPVVTTTATTSDDSKAKE